MDGLSCSDSDDGFDDDNASESNADDEDNKDVRIQFKGHDVAEAIDDEKSTSSRSEFLVKVAQEETTMVRSEDWDLARFVWIDSFDPGASKISLQISLG